MHYCLLFGFPIDKTWKQSTSNIFKMNICIWWICRIKWNVMLLSFSLSLLCKQRVLLILNKFQNYFENLGLNKLKVIHREVNFTYIKIYLLRSRKEERSWQNWKFFGIKFQSLLKYHLKWKKVASRLVENKLKLKLKYLNSVFFFYLDYSSFLFWSSSLYNVTT